MKKFVDVFLICLLFMARNAGAVDRVQVQVLSKYRLDEISVQAPDARWHGQSLNGERWERSLGAQSMKLRVEGSNLRLEGGDTNLVAKNIQIAAGANPMRISGDGFEPRNYFGLLKVEAREGKLWLRDELTLENYVAGVLPREVPAQSPLEALKAQAVLIRTYAVKQRGALSHHAGEGFDFCDLTHCQNFGGVPPQDERLMEAMRATRGEVLLFKGELIDALFHSTCGGHTSANQNVFQGRPLAYLQGVDDGAYCKSSPQHDWTAEVPLSSLESAFRREPSLNFVGPLRGLQSARREPQGRWFEVEAIGGNRVDLSAEKFLSLVGRQIGWNQIKSAWFEVSIDNGIATFSGHGLGHGVGLCQEGAIGMALAGEKYRDILAHYFPGTKLGLHRERGSL